MFTEEERRIVDLCLVVSGWDLRREKLAIRADVVGEQKCEAVVKVLLHRMFTLTQPPKVSWRDRLKKVFRKGGHLC